MAELEKSTDPAEWPTKDHTSPQVDGVPSNPPSQIGRYRIERLLGQGGFGLVYLAHDDQLNRPVAIKVPHARLVSKATDAEAYLTEARTVANLDHPNVVPVYDVGNTDEFPCYVVSKYIDGIDLATRLKQSRPSLHESVDLVAMVAAVLHHAHRQGLVHRDVKPGNILLDKSGKPFVSDFGLALREQDIGKGPHFAGTPAYMSPEQARGEGHRVDGRSDVFSLGVVFYELLTGRRPFRAESQDELLEQISDGEARPPRQIEDAISKELERICLKSLAKRASDRYTTALDMADDLRHWSDANPRASPSTPAEPVRAATANGASRLSGKDAFLSYATPDKVAAFRLCELLEQQGVACWIAPRDVIPGSDYAEAIISAIEDTSTTVLLFSTHTNASIHVRHEVERATSKRKRVIPIRLEDLPFGPSFEFHLASSQWIEAWNTSLDRVAIELAHSLRGESAPPSPAVSDPVTPTPITPVSSQPVRIVPKGLRSFDATDADFFLELLPGPRDRDGLPDSIRFWKSRIESAEGHSSFSVGLVYGPSGCGKSSLVRAGLLPRLSPSVTPVYIEATAEETESRLLKGLRRQVPGLPSNLGLTDSLAALRRGQFLKPGQKILLVLDQFEQWLHAKRNDKNPELVQALRHCDGGRLQAIVMVRDDFWLSVSRFMQALEIRVVEGENSRLADLFDPRHARSVLAAYGRAWGALPDTKRNKDQEAFLDQAIAGLTQEGKVISVRLALFAEMVKGKIWTPATLKQVGGTEGVGVAFLDEMFTASTAPPQHRFHQRAAQAVLNALLPDAGTDIKGHMRSRQELLEASGYANHPGDFDELISILDSGIRLITPTDPEGKDDSGQRVIQSGEKYYQLTHDYLVPSLRDWLTRKQKETRRGRAELLLADRAAVWSARPENRQLPSLWQSLQIRWFIAKKHWTLPQQKMMQQEGRVHTARVVLAALLLAASALTWRTLRDQAAEQRKATHAAELVQRLLDADTTQVPAVISEVAGYRQWADGLLKQEFDKPAATPQQKLHAGLALLPVDASKVEYVFARLLDATPREVPVIRNFLKEYKADLMEKLWAVALTPADGKESQRLRAAAALAIYDQGNKKWDAADSLVVKDLVAENPIFLGEWSEAFRPVKNEFLDALAEILRDRTTEHAEERSLATNLLLDYAADNPRVLADALMDADEKQFNAIFPKLTECGEHGSHVLASEIDRALPPDANDDARESLARRQANAAVALLRMKQPTRVWPLLKLSPDPRVRTYLIHGFAPLRIDVAALMHQFDQEQDASTRRALILSLGEFEAAHFPPAALQPFIGKLLDLYQNDPDAGIHGAAEWALRQWKQRDKLAEIDARVCGDEPTLQAHKRTDKRQWYIDNQGQTFVILDAQQPFKMGSPDTEPDRKADEVLHARQIARRFAIAAKEITRGQFEKFREANPDFKSLDVEQWSRTADSPQVGVDWHDAARYLNWLSKVEGIPEDQWCYEPNSEGKYAEGMKTAANYLQRTGYRLPTEAEWEFACRSGTSTSRYYGASDKLLPKYAWVVDNAGSRSWPVGMLKPNDSGLFDMLGNAFEWCDDSYRSLPATDAAEPINDSGTSGEVNEDHGRVMHGGSYVDPGSLARSALRLNFVPGYRDTDLGFARRGLALDRPTNKVAPTL